MKKKEMRQEQNQVIWLYLLSWKCKLATVMSYKADVSSVSPSSERKSFFRITVSLETLIFSRFQLLYFIPNANFK